jgi:uncharacterized protein
MLIENSFDVDADPDRVFDFLQNPHNVATCFPGAELTEDLGDDSYRGKVKIKLGPVTAAFSGIAKITEKDAAARRAVLVAEGKDARGSGTAKATATMRVEPAETGSRVQLTTDLTISGRLAQFGRGIMADVSNRMVGDLARRVQERIESESAAASQTAAPERAGTAETTTPGTEDGTASDAPAPAPATTPGTEDAAEDGTAFDAPTGTAGTEATGSGADAPAAGDVTGSVTDAGGVSEAATVPAAGGDGTTTAGAEPGAAPETTTDAATAPAAGSGGASGADTGAVSGATTGMATAPATEHAAATTPPATSAAPARTPAPAAEPDSAIKATTLLKVVVTGVFRRLFARLRGRSPKA